MYKAGIIGCGNIATQIDNDSLRKEIWTHEKAYLSHPKINLVSASDSDLDKLNSMNSCYNLYTDYLTMVTEEQLDIVSVCTPTNTHKEIIKKLCKTKVKGIFCEKPVAELSASGRDIAKICKQNDIVIAVNFMRRWDPVFKKVKTLLDNGEIGKLQTITAHTGTALLMSASHLIDTILFLGGNIKSLYGKLQRDFVRNVHGQDDFGGHAYFETVEGVSGFLKATATSEDHLPFELDLIGSKGRIRIFNYGNEIEMSKFGDHQFMSRYKNWHTVKVNYEKEERMLNAIDDIIKCIKNKEEPASNAHTATYVNDFIEAIYKSDRNNSIVNISY